MSRVRVALVVFCDIMLIAALVLLLQLDRLVNGTLYSYGLVFSYDWATPYWMAFRITAALIVVAVVVISLVELPHPAFEERADEK
jgi:hypothetical protein